MDAKTNTVVGSYQLDAVRSLRRDADEVYWQLPKALVKREVICFICRPLLSLPYLLACLLDALLAYLWVATGSRCVVVEFLFSVFPS